jgi:hypothetical protein
MPTISWFYGIAIRVFYNDHAPPHFHAFYESREARVAIETGEVISGHLPTRQRRLVREWTLMYHDRLMEAWAHARIGRAPERIPGLDADNAD